jgi:hypothetical protein
VHSVCEEKILFQSERDSKIVHMLPFFVEWSFAARAQFQSVDVINFAQQVHRVTSEHRGLYTVTATNAAGSVSTTATLTVVHGKCTAEGQRAPSLNNN